MPLFPVRYGTLKGPRRLPLIGGKFGVHHGCLTDHSNFADPLPASSQSLRQGGGSGQAVNGTLGKTQREKT